MAERPPLILFILLFILLTLPQSGDGTHTDQQRDTLARFQDSLKASRDALLESGFWSGYGNVTGFLLSYDDAVHNRNESDWPFHQFSPENPFVEDEKFSILPNDVSDRVKQFWGVQEATAADSTAYLLNISGWASGEFEATPNKLTKLPLKLPQYLMDYYKSALYDIPVDDASVQQSSKVGDIGYADGKIDFSFKNLDYNFKEHDLSQFVYTDADKIDDAVIAEVEMVINNNQESESHRLTTLGVYFQKSGALVTTSRSGKFHGSIAFPHLAMTEEHYNKSKVLMLQYVNNTNVGKQVTIDNMNTFILESIDKCEFVNYIQLAKTEYSYEELRAIDEELKNPTGRPITGSIPKVAVQEFLSYSPDCGVIIHKKADTKLAGDKIEVIISSYKKMGVILLAVIFAQLYTMVKQYKTIRTPGQYSIVSSSTVFMILYADSVVALTLFYLSMYFESLFLLMVVVSSVLYVMCILETQFLTHIRIAQMNERGTTWWEILRGSSTPAALPRPVTDANNTTPVPAPAAAPAPAPNADQDANAGMSVVVLLMFSAIVTTFVIAQATTWRASYRQMFGYVALMAVNSYWVPQFFRHTLKNRRSVFEWRFMVQLSVIRLLPINLLYLMPNLLQKERHVGFVVVLDAWVAFQLLLVYLQARLNPRFWINEKWLPKAYNYHPQLSMQDLEKGFSSDFLENMNLDDTSADNVIDCKIDCTICMAEITIPIIKDKAAKKPKINTKDYMITPCSHAFHSECLESWSKYKLQCPVCRSGLPPV